MFHRIIIIIITEKYLHKVHPERDDSWQDKKWPPRWCSTLMDTLTYRSWLSIKTKNTNDALHLIIAF